MKRNTRLVLAGARLVLALPLVLLATEWLIYQQHSGLNGSMTSSGEKRHYLVHVPDTYDGSQPVPLVLSLHGAGGRPAQQRDLSGWNRLADVHGFIVIYPAGVEALGFTRAWRAFEGRGLDRDVQFFDDLLDEANRSFNIDPNRIYVNGLSNGGGMSFALSCTLAERITAVGLVGAAQTLPSSWCPEPTPMPAIVFHGTEDNAVPYEGGTSWVGPDGFPAVQDWVSSWALRNGCDPEPEVDQIEHDVVRTWYPTCQDEAEVVLYSIAGGGHTWPGGEPLPEWFSGETSKSISATETMWAFFQGRLELPTGR